MYVYKLRLDSFQPFTLNAFIDLRIRKPITDTKQKMHTGKWQFFWDLMQEPHFGEIGNVMEVHPGVLL